MGVGAQTGVKLLPQFRGSHKALVFNYILMFKKLKPQQMLRLQVADDPRCARVLVLVLLLGRWCVRVLVLVRVFVLRCWCVFVLELGTKLIENFLLVFKIDNMANF